ncbi:hypothetical protein B0H14DRAFT_3166858 [Mycena olivaceomarginata]|nr:hypothetical protein B0H14DRAFT_3166858 [Mycena olivaceomarginata]
MSTATKPAIVIIPASFSPLSLYSAVITDLESHGYSVHGVELQTVGRREKAPSMYDDAAAVASVASKLAEEGKTSYSSPIPSKGLAKSVREKEGKQGGIARIVFVAAVVPSEGQSLMDAMVDVKMDSHHVQLKDEYLVMDVAGAAEVSYSDMPLDEALSWASRMREHAVASFQQKLTYAAYKDIPVSYLLCEEDRGCSGAAEQTYRWDGECDGRDECRPTPSQIWSSH